VNASHPRKRLRAVISVAVLAGALILLIATEWGSLPEADMEGPAPSGPRTTQKSSLQSSTPGITGGPTPVRAFNAPRIPPPSPHGAERSPLADKLNDPARSPRDDVATVAELFANYLEAFRKLPVGTNPEITAALAGDNARGHAPLAPDNRAINAAGELVDRWGTPYFFHHVSREVMEIRAAGPDRRHFTADDVVWPEAEAATVAAGL
jgi:hypothetical protein